MQFSFNLKLTSGGHCRIVKTIIFIGLFMIGSVMVANAQDTQFPNELSGFEFFKSGKLNGLRLLTSTKDDVIRVMGKDCEHNCDYDEDWKISFSYVNSGWSKTSNDQVYKPKSEFVGKLAGISFRPKRQILLTETNVFPKEFTCLNGVTTSGNLKYNSRSCINESMNEKRIIYSMSRETMSDGTVLIQNQQRMNIGYLMSEKDDDEFYALVEK